MIAFVFPLLATAATAQNAYRLSAPLERAPTGLVQRARPSRDGSRVLYQARPEEGAPVRLFRATLDGSEPVVDLGSVQAGEATYDLTRDGSHVVYLRFESGTGLVTLVGRRGDGGGPEVRLSGEGGMVQDFLLSPAGDLVLFRASEIPGEGADLYAVSTRGGRIFRINGPRSPEGSVAAGYVLGPDGRSVYYLQESEPGTNELFRGSVVGRVPRRLCAPHAPKSAVQEFALTDDQAHVVYRADSRANGLFELFVATADGSGAPQRIHPDLPVNADVRSFELSPDQSRIVFLADLTAAAKIELHSVALDGSGYVRLNQDLGASADVLDFALAPDSTEVVFRANADGAANVELFRAPLDGSSAATRLGPDLPSGTNVLAGYLPRARHVLYATHRTGLEEVLAIERAPLAAPLLLGGPLAGPEVLMASEQRFFFTGPSGLMSVPVDFSLAPVAVDAPGNLIAIAEGAPETLLGLSSRFYETVERESVVTSELRAVPTDGSAASRRISAPFPSHAYIEQALRFRTDPSGRFAAYETGPEARRLFLVSTSGRDEPMRVTETSRTFAFSHDGLDLVVLDEGGLFRLTTSGERIDLLPGALGFALAERARSALVSTAAHGLIVLPLDGGASVDVLAGLPSGLTLTGSFLTQDARWVLLWLEDSAGVVEIYRVPSDGSAAPEAIPSSRGAAPVFDLPSPDGTRLAFRVLRQLFLTDLAVGAPSSLIHDATSSFFTYLFDAGGQGLLVLDAGDLVLHRFDGSTLALNASHPGGALQFQLDPTGARALYATEVRRGFSDVTFDLWSVPLDGSTPAVRINTDEVGPTGSRVSPPELGLGLSPDGRSAVFTSLGRLVSAPLDGSAAPRVLVDDPARFPWAFPWMSFTEDSRTLVFASAGLYEVPVQGGRPERRLDSADGRLFNSDSFQILRGRRGVLFLADPLAPEAHELFNAPLDRAVRGVPR